MSASPQIRPKARAAAVAAGGRIVKAYEDQCTWLLASPDNHGVDIAGWADLEA